MYNAKKKKSLWQIEADLCMPAVNSVAVCRHQVQK